METVLTPFEQISPAASLYHPTCPASADPDDRGLGGFGPPRKDAWSQMGYGQS